MNPENRINESRKVSENSHYIKISCISIQEQNNLKRRLLKTTPYTIASKRIKLKKYKTYTLKLQNTLKEIKHLNKRKYIPYLWNRRLNFVKLAILSNFSINLTQSLSESYLIFYSN